MKRKREFGLDSTEQNILDAIRGVGDEDEEEVRKGTKNEKKKRGN